MPRAKVAWALINYGPIYSPVYTSHLSAAAHAARELGAIISTDRMYTSSAENAVAEALLASDCTHVFMCESDMLLPTTALTELLQLDTDIASGLYFLRNGDGQPCLYKRMVTPAGTAKSYAMSPLSVFPTETPFKLNGCPGLGCVLIKRSVFERVPSPWFDLKEKGYGSDLYFYTKCRDVGVEVWVDPRVRCGQIDYKIWDFHDYEERLKNDPSFPVSGSILGTLDYDHLERQGA